jgi:hypothetical protein
LVNGVLGIARTLSGALADHKGKQKPDAGFAGLKLWNKDGYLAVW